VSVAIAIEGEGKGAVWTTMWREREIERAAWTIIWREREREPTELDDRSETFDRVGTRERKSGCEALGMDLVGSLCFCLQFCLLLCLSANLVLLSIGVSPEGSRTTKPWKPLTGSTQILCIPTTKKV
jgi:hypothetical protein